MYLDEIDSMPLGLQAKLLRVIQEKRVRRLGDVRERPVDVRIIGSTSVLPRQAVEQGLMRPDLYFRLAVVEIGLPPLRKRQEDIPLLCSHFLRKHGKGRNISISPEVMSAFLTYDWPGNVRELEHAIEGSLAFLRGNTIELVHIPPTVRGITATTTLSKGSIRNQLKSHEKAAIEEALRQGGSVSQAARILGIPRQTLQYRMKIHGLKAPRSRSRG